jgi:hypothetical protein
MSKKLFKYKKSASFNFKSKGVRLGWVSLRDVKIVKLEETLDEREVVLLDNKYSPMLVP